MSKNKPSQKTDKENLLEKTISTKGVEGALKTVESLKENTGENLHEILTQDENSETVLEIGKLIDLSNFPLVQQFLIEKKAATAFIEFAKLSHSHKTSGSRNFALYIAEATEKILEAYMEERDYFIRTGSKSKRYNDDSPSGQRDLVYLMLGSYSGSEIYAYRKVLRDYIQPKDEEMYWGHGYSGEKDFFTIEFKPNTAPDRYS
jgi:hypothetical protein